MKKLPRTVQVCVFLGVVFAGPVVLGLLYGGGAIAGYMAGMFFTFGAMVLFNDR